MKFNLSLIAFLFIALPTFSCDLPSDKIALANYQWLTEDYPPYNYSNETGQTVGIFTDVLMAIYQELDIHYKRENIKVTPWARLYNSIQNNDVFAGFSMANTPERERLFKLVPLPSPTKTSILILTSRKHQLKNIAVDDLTIAVVREDVGQLRLNKANILAEQIETTTAESMLKMLIYHRVDAIAYAEDVAHFQYKKQGLLKGSLVPIHVLDDEALASFAFHKNTPACVIDLFAKTIAELHQRGDLAVIRNKYISND